MLRNWFRGPWKYLLATGVALALNTGVSRAEDNETDLRTLIELQKQQIEQQSRQLDAQNKKIEELIQRVDTVQQAGTVPIAAPADGAALPAKVEIEESALRKIVADYLQDNPGAGMPSGVQTGWYPKEGFTIRSTPAPKFTNWDDECKIPFELRIRGRIQFDYYNYQPTDTLNHQTGAHYAPAAGSISEMLIKRGRFAFHGNIFTPDLRYELEFDGNTRGIAGFQGNKVAVATVPPAGSGIAAPGVGTAASPIGNNVLVDNTVRLFRAYIAYDMHPTCFWPGCGADCCDGTSKYAPTLTLIGGKDKPYFAFEEWMGSGHQQFVEYGMSQWYFDLDNDNLMMIAGLNLKAIDDRFFSALYLTNGVDSQFASSQLGANPGGLFCAYYDFGGSWDKERKRWNLYGDCISDIDYSCCPVGRIGGAVAFQDFARASIYGDVQQSFVRVMSAGPNGTSLIGELAGDGLSAANQGAHALDTFNQTSVETFLAGKYRGFSFYNGWFVRDLDGFQTTPNGGGNILYSSTVAKAVPGTTIGTSTTAMFPHGALIDYGTQLQAGYFLVPKRLEVAARWCWIRGESGDINGNGRTLAVVNVPNVGAAGVTPVRIIDGAFRDFHEADEYTVGLNYYFYRHQVKWQTDVGYFRGGNPAAGGSAATGFISGVDGWLIRTQVQLWF